MNHNSFIYYLFEAVRLAHNPFRDGPGSSNKNDKRR